MEPLILVTLDSKGKIRIVEITNAGWSEEDHGFKITRKTYQFGGKQTEQPDIIIQRGKAGRTLQQQADLEFNSRVKKYLDKGYKKWEGDINDEAGMRELIGEFKTGNDGIIKPMLAKQADKVAAKYFNLDYYGSRKVNGVRCLIFYKDGKIQTSSRGSINYDLALFHIINHPNLIKFFEKHPDIIMDGEIYKHGMTLNNISGLVRHISIISQTEPLEFYWYDIVDTTKPFTERWYRMNSYAVDMGLKPFDPEREWEEGELKIQLLPQVPMTTWDTMKIFHDKYVREGWEGLVIRKADAVYGPGKRSNDMIKIKEYFDADYEIVGLSEGLREEDMCFVLKTPEGQEFKAKPHGDRALKQWYRDNIDDLIGKLATVKYFEMSGKEGSKIPQQPTLVCVRDYE